MTKCRKKSISMIMIIVMIILGIGHTHTDVYASKNTKAIKAYKKYLTQKKVYWNGDSYEIDTKELSFYVYDLDHDGVKELFLYYPHSSICPGFEKVLTYKKGKIKEIQHFYGADYPVVYKKKGIVKVDGIHGGYIWTRYYKLNKGKWITVAEIEGADTPFDTKPTAETRKWYEEVCSNRESQKVVYWVNEGRYYNYYYKCQVNGKNVSGKKYENMVKKLMKNNSEKKINYHSNTKKKRSKYLK